MKNTELGPLASTPTDSEDCVVCGRPEWRAHYAVGVPTCAGFNDPEHWRLGYERLRDALDAERRGGVILVNEYNATLAALGEARGTASASESLDKTQNSEQGALRASLDDQLRQAVDRSVAEERMLAAMTPTARERWIDTWAAGVAPRLVEEGIALDRALGAATHPGASGDAPTAPPAPDLLRENARLREEEEVQRSAIRDCLARLNAAESELTRARAAHLENAELLAKAWGALREARQAITWAVEDDADEPLRASTIGKLTQAQHAIDAALAPPPPPAPAKEEG